jgi:hypothetical protein
VFTASSPGINSTSSHHFLCTSVSSNSLTTKAWLGLCSQSVSSLSLHFWF